MYVEMDEKVQYAQKKKRFEVNHSCQTNGRVVVVSNNHAQINVLLAVDLPVVNCFDFL